MYAFEYTLTYLLADNHPLVVEPLCAAETQTTALDQRYSVTAFPS